MAHLEVLLSTAHPDSPCSLEATDATKPKSSKWGFDVLAVILPSSRCSPDKIMDHTFKWRVEINRETKVLQRQRQTAAE